MKASILHPGYKPVGIPMDLKPKVFKKGSKGYYGWRYMFIDGQQYRVQVHMVEVSS